jgi:glutathione peroxidase
MREALPPDDFRGPRSTMSVYDIPIATIDGTDDGLDRVDGKVTLVVNVASQCGLTPQYTGLERIHEEYADRGFAVVGVPCNQFLGQEPGTSDEIVEFCSTNYGVTFPLMEKIEVNGGNRHPLYDALTQTADADGHAGDIRWNFEKFLLGRDGEVRARFAPQVDPEAPEVRDAIEDAL